MRGGFARTSGSRVARSRAIARGGGRSADPIGSWFIDFDLGRDRNTGRNTAQPLATTRKAYANANSADTVYYRVSDAGAYREHPASIVTSANLALWLTPGAVYETSSQFVWEDRGLGSGNHFVSVRDRPTVTSSWLDGNPGIAFDGTLKQVLRCGGFTGIAKGSRPCAYIVASINSDHPTGTPTLLYLAGKLPAQSAYQLLSVTVGAVSGYVVSTRLGSAPTTSTATASAGGGYANGTPRLFKAVADNGADRAEAWSNGTLHATAAAGASGGLFATPTHAVIGSGDEGGGATRWFDGTIGEVLLFDSEPTAAEEAALLLRHFAPRWPTIYAGHA